MAPLESSKFRKITRFALYTKGPQARSISNYYQTIMKKYMQVIYAQRKQICAAILDGDKTHANYIRLK